MKGTVKGRVKGIKGAEIQKGDFVPSYRDFVKLCKIIGTCTDESMRLNPMHMWQIECDCAA